MTTFIFKPMASERQQRPDREVGQAPGSARGKFHYVRNAADAAEITAQFRDQGKGKPHAPILVESQGGRARKIIVGDGAADASELQDLAMAALAKKPFDFDTAREKAGAIRREDFDPAFREALQDRIKKHKENPLSDPPRQPRRWTPKEKTQW